MKLSEVIGDLQKIVNTYGDVEILKKNEYEDNFGFYETEFIETSHITLGTVEKAYKHKKENWYFDSNINNELSEVNILILDFDYNEH